MTPNRGARSPVAGTADREASTARNADAWWLVFAVWVIATLSTLGALFFSQVMQLPPCTLCWYQRIFVFPLVLMLPFGLFPVFDRKAIRYALPLTAAGALVSVFQLLLIYGVIPETLQPCGQGVSCKEIQFELFGFLSIPLMAFLALMAMIALLAMAHFRSSR